MSRPLPRRAPLAALILVLGAVLVGAPGAALAGATRTPTVGAVPATGAWTGSVSIWRSSAFSSQADTRWCTAASVQMMLNLVLDRSVTSATEQRTIMAWEQANDSLAVSDGSDPQGWAGALRRFGSSRTSTYHWETHDSMQAALKAAAYKLRMTGRPAGLLVYGGTHANVLVGFSATADPALGGSWAVTGVQLAGPWYPRPGVDLAPGAWISATSLAGRFGRYTETDGLDAWVGKWVIVNS